MKRILLPMAFVLVLANNLFAIDITIAWDASAGATGYKISLSTDNGHTWGSMRETGSTATTFVWAVAPEDRLLLFKIAATNGTQTLYNNYGGAWYDHRLKTTATVYPRIGIKDDTGTAGWDAVTSATNYMLSFSDTIGSTWATNLATGNVTSYRWQAIPTNKLMLIKGCVTVGGVQTCRPWAGAWYDKRYYLEYGEHLYWQHSEPTVVISH